MRSRIGGEIRAGPPRFDEVRDTLIEAEQGEGWLVRCEENGCYLALNDRFVESLGATLEALGGTPVLEVCAGGGALSASLRSAGIDVLATDASPPVEMEGAVERLGADEALLRYRPTIVLGSFVPIDAGVDQRVLDDPCVRHYVVLNARLTGELGAACLWRRPGWSPRRLDDVTRWMITRHDVWVGAGLPLLSRGEAWLLSRT